MADAKVLLLCNNRIALPALRYLLFFNQVSGIVVPASNRSLAAEVKELIGAAPVPLRTVDRRNFREVIRQEIGSGGALAVLIMTFPYLIPEELLLLPPKGFINFHYGPLPGYRGPEPIFAQVRLQEPEPGLSVHVVTAQIDAGPVILRETVAYDLLDTYGMLQQKLAAAGEQLVGVLMKILSFGSIVPAVPQDESKAAYHPKPTAASLMIDWQSMDAKAIRALVNACNPWNKGCGAAISHQVIGITEVELLEGNGNHRPGEIIRADVLHGLQVASCDGKIIKINIIYMPEGILSGHQISRIGVGAGDVFG